MKSSASLSFVPSPLTASPRSRLGMLSQYTIHGGVFDHTCTDWFSDTISLIKLSVFPPPSWCISYTRTHPDWRCSANMIYFSDTHILITFYILFPLWISPFSLFPFPVSRAPTPLHKSMFRTLSQYNAPVSGGGTTHTARLSAFLPVFSINTILLLSSILSYSLVRESPRIPLPGSLQDECCFQIKISPHIWLAVQSRRFIIGELT